MKEVMARQKQRTDTAARWAEANPVLLDGELGFERDTGRFKLGDGAGAWSALPYRSGVLSVNGTQPDAAGNVALALGGAHDLVIRTQLQFDVMVGSPDWLGARNVLLCGAFTYTSADGKGITVPDSVMCIDGVNNAELCAVNNMDFLLQYEFLPVDGGRRVTGLSLRAQGQCASGFLNMTGLLGCSVTDCLNGYSNCTQLVNCFVQPASFGFVACKQLTNCVARTTRGALTTCYSNCEHLQNCTATITRGMVSRGFDYCKSLSNCQIGISGTSEATGYNNCSYCTCCTKAASGANLVLWKGTTTKRCDATCDV